MNRDFDQDKDSYCDYCGVTLKSEIDKMRSMCPEHWRKYGDDRPKVKHNGRQKKNKGL